MKPRKRTRSLTVAIEQHIAMGRTPADIVRVLQTDMETIAAVWRDMDAACAMTDIARAETAAVYSARVPEHSSTATPLPEHETEWERRRLASAGRRLTAVPRHKESA